MGRRWESPPLRSIEGAPHSADLRDLWVTPEARNTGVASRLVQAAADQAMRDGCTKLYYWVSTENGRAIGFAQQRRLPGHVAASNHPYRKQGVRRPGDRVCAVARQRPSCGAHLDTITADLKARAPLTQHHGCRTGGCQTQIPGTTAGIVTISLCCFDGGEGIDM